MNHSEYIDKYLTETAEIAKSLNREAIAKVVEILSEVRSQGGRVFFLGVGGGAASGSHAANDFTRIAKIPAICLTDNIGAFTALINDEGWEAIFRRQLEMQKLTPKDCLFIYSVGGGTETVSKNLVVAINLAKKIGAKIIGVVGRDTGATAREADACIVVPCLDDSRRTPHTEDFQLIMDHLLANLLSQISEKDVEEA